MFMMVPSVSDVHAAAAEETKGDLENPHSSPNKPTKDDKKVVISTSLLHTPPAQLPTAEHLLEAHQRGVMTSEPLRSAKEVAQMMKARSISAGTSLYRHMCRLSRMYDSAYRSTYCVCL